MSVSDDFKTRFLLAALPDVPFDGWTQALMDRTAASLNAPHAQVARAFPKGPRDLAIYFSDWANAAVLKILDKKNISELRIREKIFEGVKARLEVLMPHKQALSSALAFLSVPPQALSLPGMVWRAADCIWWAAGDASTDYNHYTKRGLLSGIIVATTLYWINDTSKGHEKTWAFLNRRIDEVLKLGQTLGRLKPRGASDNKKPQPRRKSKSKKA